MSEQINSFLSTYKIQIALIFVGLVLILGGLFAGDLIHQPAAAKSFPAASLIKPNQTQPNQLKVNVSGAVIRPGVYALNNGDRVEDALKMAGGFSEEANAAYVSKVLNLSLKISDGQKIYIPFNNENTTMLAANLNSSNPASVSSLVGLNTGSQAQLESLPGIGPVTAVKIIQARPYTDISDLLTKKAVSKSVFTKIQSLVDLN